MDTSSALSALSLTSKCGNSLSIDVVESFLMGAPPFASRALAIAYRLGTLVYEGLYVLETRICHKFEHGFGE